jgi:hypothetical protein
MSEELKALMYVPQFSKIDLKYYGEPRVKFVLENWFKEPRELTMNRKQLVNVIKALTTMLEKMDRHGENKGSV